MLGCCSKGLGCRVRGIGFRVSIWGRRFSLRRDFKLPLVWECIKTSSLANVFVNDGYLKRLKPRL